MGAFTTLWNVGGAGIPLADPDRVEPHNRALRDAAPSIDSWAYAEAVLRTQRLSRRVVEGFLAGFDLLVTPTMACLPPPIGAWRAGTEEDPSAALRNSYPMGVFTSLFNVTGQPAISLPVHHDPATGLPVGVQIVAAPWREELLLQVAQVIERALPRADRRPSVG
ncbi:amidase family protein [Streptomyces sp. NPDC003007]